MDNIMKLVILGASVLLTVAVVVAAVMIFSSGQEVIKEGGKDLSSLSQSIAAKKLEMYNNTVVAGYDVVNAIRTQVEGNGGITVKVTTSAGSAITYSQKDQVNNKYAVTNPSDNAYINPTGQFDAKIISNANKVVIGLEFAQK